jgi:hypothetical protein
MPGTGPVRWEANLPNDDAKTDPEITVTDELDGADVAVITDGLRAYDLNQIGYHDFRPLAVFVRDPQTGKVIGGLPRTVRIRSPCRLVLSARGLAPCTDRQSGIGDGGRRGQTTRLHPIALTTLSIEAPCLRETGHCRSDDRLRAARPTRYYMMKKPD